MDPQDAAPLTLVVPLTRAQFEALERLGTPFGRTPEAVAATAVQAYLDLQDYIRAGGRARDGFVWDSF